MELLYTLMGVIFGIFVFVYLINSFNPIITDSTTNFCSKPIGIFQMHRIFCFVFENFYITILLAFVVLITTHVLRGYLKQTGYLGLDKDRLRIN